MKICVFGLGSIGGHLALRIAQNGHDVSVIARGATLEAVRKNGLTMKDGKNEWHARPKAFDKTSEAGPQDVVIVSVKTSALSKIASQIPPLLGPDTSVVFMVNGVPWWLMSELSPDLSTWAPPLAEMISSLRDVVSPERVLGGIAYSANHVLEPGVVWNDGPPVSKYEIGEPDGSVSARVEAIAAAMTHDNTRGVAMKNIRDAMWLKLAMNSVNGPLGSLTSATTSTITADPELAPLIASLNEEFVNVATACGSANPRSAYLPTIGVGNHKASMLQDFEAGRTPEIDTFLTAIVNLAKLKGVPVPSFMTVLALLRAKARYQRIYP